MNTSIRSGYIRITILLLCMVYGMLGSVISAARTTETLEQLTQSRRIATTVDLHLTALSRAIADGVSVDLCSPDAWLFFDNVRPNDVIRQYTASILIDGQPLEVDVNARVVVYRHGAVVIPHAHDFQALTFFSETDFGGAEESLSPYYYYTNSLPDSVPAHLCRPLALDNVARSLVLRRGYAATLACEADGMGYSRVFVADDDDLRLASLPVELDGHVSFVRVVRWQYPSRKGWAGSSWSSMPDSLRYAPQQSDYVGATWYYNWGTTPSGDTDAVRHSHNQEFVPEKWGAGGSLRKLYTLDDVSHLLAYNEPDHGEQSNVSVGRAIEEWPMLQRTGLRLGSPATTDFNWLYNFMNIVRQRNYRVDYVVVHAYWGGLSGAEWYQRLKEVHERTGRPLWIKEWNNGANWTKEGWPSGTEAQQAKQLRDLQDILTVMDTCSFIERYSIYNWVEEKRMLISSSAKLTPAGEYYAQTRPPYFFRHEGEYVPTWRVSEPPVLRYDSLGMDNRLHLSWSDVNGEQISRFVVEQDSGTGDYQPVAEVEGCERLRWEASVPRSASTASLRVSSISAMGTRKVSNAVVAAVVPHSDKDTLLLTSVLVRELWQPLVFSEPFLSSPVAVLGVPTYRNKMPMTASVRTVSSGHADLRLGTWDYQENPTIFNPDTLSCLVLPTGVYDWDGVRAQVATEEVSDTAWHTVDFPSSFDVLPVVLATLNTEVGVPATVAVCDVTCSGFRMRLCPEAQHAGLPVRGTVSYLAVMPGTGRLQGRPLCVGLTPEEAVGDIYSEGYQLLYDYPFDTPPHLFAQMQTLNDDAVATLRITRRDNASATLIKEREKSLSFARVCPEQVGYLLIGDAAADGIEKVSDSGQNLPSSHGQGTAVFDLSGRRVGDSTDVLPRGVYICEGHRFCVR